LQVAIFEEGSKKMSLPFEEGPFYQRWYDHDPALSKALQQLRQASDKYQAQVALNIIKIVVEHQAEATTNGSNIPVDANDVSSFLSADNDTETQLLRRRWYDVNETLRSAMQLLHDCPDDLQRTLIPTIVSMIEQSL